MTWIIDILACIALFCISILTLIFIFGGPIPYGFFYLVLLITMVGGLWLCRRIRGRRSASRLSA